MRLQRSDIEAKVRQVISEQYGVPLEEVNELLGDEDLCEVGMAARKDRIEFVLALEEAFGREFTDDLDCGAWSDCAEYPWTIARLVDLIEKSMQDQERAA